MYTVPNNYFFVTKTIETPTGKMHCIAWRWEYTKRFLKNLSKEMIDLGWMRSGDYCIKHKENKTHVIVSERILKDFVQIIDYLARRYQA